MPHEDYLQILLVILFNTFNKLAGHIEVSTHRYVDYELCLCCTPRSMNLKLKFKALRINLALVTKTTDCFGFTCRYL